MNAFKNFLNTPNTQDTIDNQDVENTLDNQELSNKTLDNYQAKNSEPEKNTEPEKTDAEYFEMINPETGMRYEIPFLSYSDNDYFYKYVEYMKLKEKNPEQFEKILNWN